MYSSSELILNEDGSIFHLHLLPEMLAQNIILVGDMARVDMIADFFDNVELTVQNREFRTITGSYMGKRISVISTGIGTDNIDIVLTELDALVNVDLSTRSDKPEKTSLNIIRIGTSGGLQEYTPEGSFVVSKYSIGFDGVLNYYSARDFACDLQMEKDFVSTVEYNKRFASPYCIHSSQNLLDKFNNDPKFISGITISAPGFYGPQGRSIRLTLTDPNLNSKISDFEYDGLKVTNYEMESSAIAGLSALLGHQATTVCLIIANRYAKRFIGDYKPLMNELVLKVLNLI